MAPAGRFAPTPSGDLHLGNLRTALLAWLFARWSGRDFLLRIEDLDAARAGSAERQLADLAALGLDWDGPVVSQSGRTDAYRAVLRRLMDAGLTYNCYCTRREVAAAATAPHGPPGAYPGTCRNLTVEQQRRRVGRLPALRLRSEVSRWTVHDLLRGKYTGMVDDFVLQRGDGVMAYNLAVVVDDAAQQIDQVVRGDDLLASSPRQAYLAHVLGLPPVEYAHVPLVLNPEGKRLAKRDGAVTLTELAARGVGADQVLSVVAVSLQLAEPSERIEPSILLSRFDPYSLPRDPWILDATRFAYPRFL